MRLRTMSTFGVFRSTSEMVYDASKRLKSALKSYKKTKRKKRERERDGQEWPLFLFCALSSSSPVFIYSLLSSPSIDIYRMDIGAHVAVVAKKNFRFSFRLFEVKHSSTSSFWWQRFCLITHSLSSFSSSSSYVPATYTRRTDGYATLWAPVWTSFFYFGRNEAVCRVRHERILNQSKNTFLCRSSFLFFFQTHTHIRIIYFSRRMYMAHHRKRS